MPGLVIRKRRILKLTPNFQGVVGGADVTVGLPVTPEIEARLLEIGFEQLVEGERVLPAIVGSVSRYNAEGKEYVHRDQSKETIYRQVLWTHPEFHGDERREVTSFVDRPYQRYPRSLLPPPNIELTCVLNGLGDLMITTPTHPYTASSDLLMHTVNLFLELFGEAHILDSEMVHLALPNIIRLGWHLLPPGERLWPQLQSELQPVIERQKEAQRAVFEFRLERLAEYGPDFTAIGTAGFLGYVIFGFSERNLHILESAYYGNATYVLGVDWRDLSMRTKAELVNENLYERRIEHRSNWAEEIRVLLTRA